MILLTVFSPATFNPPVVSNVNVKINFVPRHILLTLVPFSIEKRFEVPELNCTVKVIFFLSGTVKSGSSNGQVARAIVLVA